MTADLPDLIGEMFKDETRLTLSPIVYLFSAPSRKESRAGRDTRGERGAIRIPTVYLRST